MYKFDGSDMCSLFWADEATREAMRQSEAVRLGKVAQDKEEAIPQEDGVQVDAVNLEGEIDKISLPLKNLDSWEDDLLTALPLIYGPSSVKKVTIVRDGKTVLTKDWPFSRW